MDFSQYGPTGAVVVVVLLFLKYMQENQKKTDQTYDKVSKALTKLTTSTTKNTQATKSADIYLRQRNGRDNEFQEENIKAIKQIPITLQTIADKQAKSIITALKTQPVQQVKEQHVEVQTIESAIDNTGEKDKN